MYNKRSHCMPWIVIASSVLTLGNSCIGFGGGSTGGGPVTLYSIDDVTPNPQSINCSYPSPLPLPDTNLFKFTTSTPSPSAAPSPIPMEQYYYWPVDLQSPAGSLAVDTSNVAGSPLAQDTTDAIYAWDQVLSSEASTLGNTYLLLPTEDSSGEGADPVSVVYDPTHRSDGPNLDILGFTSFASTADGMNLGSATVTLYGWLTDPRYNTDTDNTRYATALHELGHAQGLMHNPDEGSAMYPSVAGTGCFPVNTVPPYTDAYNLVTNPHYIESLTTFPQSTFTIGGGDLAALALQGIPVSTANNPWVASTGSAFYTFETNRGVGTQYCQTADDFAKAVFIRSPSTGGVSAPCPPFGSGAGRNNGFGATTQPYFISSGVPLTQADYSGFMSGVGTTRGEPVEIPVVVSSIALLYNFPAPTPKLRLTDFQLCALFQGKITNWSQLGQTSHPLTFVDHSDSSEATFAISNHLSAVCGSTSGLSTSALFAPVSGSNGPYVQPNPPSYFRGATGDAGAVSAIETTPYSIGYVGGGNAKAVIGGAIEYASVNGYDPISNLPETAAALTYQAVESDQALVMSGGSATTTPMSSVRKAGCLEVVVPKLYANIRTGYSIISVESLLFYSSGNGLTNAINLQSVIGTLFNYSNYVPGKIATIDASTKPKGSGTTGHSELQYTFTSPTLLTASNCIGP